MKYENLILFDEINNELILIYILFIISIFHSVSKAGDKIMGYILGIVDIIENIEIILEIIKVFLIIAFLIVVLVFPIILIALGLYIYAKKYTLSLFIIWLTLFLFLGWMNYLLSPSEACLRHYIS